MNKGTIPIIIGVTGHRDLRESEVQHLEIKVKKIFQETKVKYKNSCIQVLSPLAEGADRLVARVGLQEGASLIAVLPMPLSEYIKDFETEESRKEFTDLLSKAEEIYELPLLEGNTLDSIQGHNESRNMQYAYVGAYVVMHSHILIALWDGKGTKQTGGTAEIVRYRLEGVPEPFVPESTFLYPPENGPVYHIITQRKEKHSQSMICRKDLGTTYLVKPTDLADIIYPARWKNSLEGQPENYYEGILKRIDEFNHDTKAISAYEKSRVNKSWVFPEDKQATLPEGAKELLDYFGVADVVAMYYQRLADKMLKWLLSTPVIAFFFFGVFGELWSMLYVLALFPMFFGLAYLLYRRAAEKIMTISIQITGPLQRV